MTEVEFTNPQALDVKDAITRAKSFVHDVLADEQISNVELEETELERPTGIWKITVGFHRPWTTPRSRAQEVLDRLGTPGASMRRSYKVLEVAGDGIVVSMKDRRD